MVVQNAMVVWLTKELLTERLEADMSAHTSGFDDHTRRLARRLSAHCEAFWRIVQGFEPCPRCLAGESCINHDSSGGASTWRFFYADEEQTARRMAAAYAHRPGYEPQWAPEPPVTALSR